MTTNNNQFECGNSEERFSHPNATALLKDSNKKWLTHVLSESTWIDCIIGHMNELSPATYRMMSLYCVCHQPVLLEDSRFQGFRIACFLPEGCYLWPESRMPSSLFCHSRTSQECGYHEESLLSLLLEKIYLQDSNTNKNENNLRELVKDVEYLYDLSIHKGQIPMTIEYLYKRICLGSTAPTFISMATFLPVHPEISKSISFLGRYVVSVSKNNAFTANHFVAKLFSTTLHVATEQEWKTLLLCRQACGLCFWDRKRVNSDIPISYGNRSWSWSWRTVSLRYQRKTYHERRDERLQWVSLWLRLLSSGCIDVEKSPKHLLFLCSHVHSS